MIECVCRAGIVELPCYEEGQAHDHDHGEDQEAFIFFGHLPP